MRNITGKPYQYIKAAGQGNVAALSAAEYLDKKKRDLRRIIMVKKIQEQQYGRSVTGKGSSGGLFGSMVRTVPDACPVLEELSGNWTVKGGIYNADTDENTQLAIANGITNIPALLFLRTARWSARMSDSCRSRNWKAWVKRMYGAVTAQKMRVGAYMGFYDYEAEDVRGNMRSMRDMRKVVLVVNTATKCGFTPQYDELQVFTSSTVRRDLRFWIFPCDQFEHRHREPTREIVAFCDANFGITFTHYRKIDVNRGACAAAVSISVKSQKGCRIDEEHPLATIRGKHVRAHASGL